MLLCVQYLLRIEDQAPDLNALPMRGALRTSLVQERRVRGEPCTILLRVVTLDEGDLIRSLVREVVPLVIGVVADGEGAYCTQSYAS